MTGYTRADSVNNIADGNIINASDLDGEFDAVVAAFNSSTGHVHDGTAANGAPITKIGPTQDVVASATALTPKTTATVDVGSSALKFKDFFFSGTGTLVGLTATGAITLNTTTNNQSYTTTGAGTITISSGTAGSINNMNIGATTAGTGKFTAITNSALTSGRVVYATTGGLETDSANLTFDGTNLGLAGGTANGVAYLNGSKVLTTGSALTFDGTNLTQTAGTPTFTIFETTSGNNNRLVLTQSSGLITYNLTYSSPTTNGHVFQIGGAEQMRLTSTGLGIGTSSPVAKLQSTGGVLVSGAAAAFTANSGVMDYFGSYTRLIAIGANTSTQGAFNFATSSTDASVFNSRMIIDSSGNVGIGTTVQKAKLQVNPGNVSTVGAIASSGLMIENYSGVGNLSQIGFGYATSSLVNTTAYIGLIETNASGSSYGDLIFGTRNVTTDTAPTERMRIDSTGNVGIGTTSPDIFGRGYGRVFGVSSASNAAIEVNSATGNGSFIDMGVNGVRLFNVYSDTSSSGIGTVTALPIFFAINNTEAMRIDSSGNLLVGKTASSNSTVGFQVVGATGETVSTMASAVAAQATFSVYSTGAAAYRFYVGMNGVSNATSTTINAISDIRLQENIRDLDAGLNKVMALKPRLYDWKEGKGANIKNARGFIAQEFEQIFPDLVDDWKDPAPEGEAPYKSVRQDLIPVLVKAIQEQQALITSLTARITAIEST